MKIIDADPTKETKRVIFKYPLHQYEVDLGLLLPGGPDRRAS